MQLVRAGRWLQCILRALVRTVCTVLAVEMERVYLSLLSSLHAAHKRLLFLERVGPWVNYVELKSNTNDNDKTASTATGHVDGDGEAMAVYL